MAVGGAGRGRAGLAGPSSSGGGCTLRCGPRFSDISQLSCKSHSTDTTPGGPSQMAVLCGLMGGFPGIVGISVKAESTELSSPPRAPANPAH